MSGPNPDAAVQAGDGSAFMAAYRKRIEALFDAIEERNAKTLPRAASVCAEQIAADRLIHIYGPGGHSNLASQELFFRAGGLMHISAILDEGTMLAGGALRSMAVERTPGYGTIVMENARLGPDDLLILVNAYGINAALIDAALTARAAGATIIGVSSRDHADQTAPDHPARHPSQANLHDLVDIHLDSCVPIGDAILAIPGLSEKTGPVSTFANAYLLNSLVLYTIAQLRARDIDPPLWRSGNAPGGDEANSRHMDRFRARMRWL